MKTQLIALIAAIAASFGMTASAETTNALPGIAAQPASYFYTGKPYDADLDAYVFNFRNYDSELNRWTTVDPSGFPDGSNGYLYIENGVFGSVDPDGLKTVTLYEAYKLQITNTFGWGDLTAAAAGGAIVGGGVGAGAGSVAAGVGAVPGAILGSIVGSLAGAVTGANISYNAFQNGIKSQYPVGDQQVAGQIVNTGTGEVPDVAVLQGTTDSIAGWTFEYEWTMSGILFTGNVYSSREYAWE